VGVRGVRKPAGRASVDVGVGQDGEHCHS
jgi:hypothetical protein